MCVFSACSIKSGRILDQTYHLNTFPRLSTKHHNRYMALTSIFRNTNLWIGIFISAFRISSVISSPWLHIFVQLLVDPKVTLWHAVYCNLIIMKLLQLLEHVALYFLYIPNAVQCGRLLTRPKTLIRFDNSLWGFLCSATVCTLTK